MNQCGIEQLHLSIIKSTIEIEHFISNHLPSYSSSPHSFLYERIQIHKFHQYSMYVQKG
jgi:hypothetical protein